MAGVTPGEWARLPRNLQLDSRTVTAMIRIYCERRHESPQGTLCEDCESLRQYADARLARCPFGTDKTTCRECPIHCYRPVERAAMKDVMRFSGPRMLWRHPILAARHLLLERKGPPPWPPVKKKGRGSADPRPLHSDAG